MAALELARKGYSVFPCKESKAPYTTNGYKAATRDEDQITTWWTRWPDALIGVPTGATNNFCVLDIDALSSLALLPGEVPPTRTHHTRSGGLHYLFKWAEPGIRSRQGLWTKIDTRGDTGYIVWWPAHGGEVAHAGQLAAIPQWLLEAVGREADAPAPRKVTAPVNGVPVTWALTLPRIKREIELIDPDCGYELWYRVGAALYHESGGYPDGLAIWDAWSSRGTKYRPGECSVKWVSFKTNRPDKLGWAGIAAQEPVPMPSPKPKAPSAGIKTVAQILDTNYPPPQYALDGAIKLTVGAWLLAGKPKEGKSWLAMNLALAVASGREYVGSKPPSGPAPVIYLAFDDDAPERFGRRYTEMGGTKEESSNILHVPEIPEDWEVESGLDLLKQLLNLYPTVKFVVIDTLGAFRTSRRNDNVYQQEYDELKEINRFAHEVGICVLIVHHFRKGALDPKSPFESISGTLGLQGGVDGMIVLHRHDYQSDFDSSQDEKLGAIWYKGRDIEECDLGARLRDGRWTPIGSAADVLAGETVRECMRILRSAPDRAWTAKEVHSEFETTAKLETVRKSLQRLARQGKLAGNRGANGGYRLR